jgi:hypothetical protein
VRKHRYKGPDYRAIIVEVELCGGIPSAAAGPLIAELIEWTTYCR